MAMSKREKRVLHRIWRNQLESPSNGFDPTEDYYNPWEILCLAETRNPVRGWRQEPASNSATTLNEYEALARAYPMLEYLRDGGYITFDPATYGRTPDDYEIRVTSAGLDLARQLDTFWGRFSVWYAERKDGPLGLLFTAGVSIICRSFDLI